MHRGKGLCIIGDGEVRRQHVSDRSSDVEILQRLLIDAGNSITSDGIFGQGTAAAVRAFQVSNGLVADAIVGPATWKALQA